MLHRVLNSILVGVGAYSTVFWFNESFYSCIWVQGGSMRPTLNPNRHLKDHRDLCLVRKWRYVPKRGDVVCVKSPISNGSVIKRVIALEGDYVYKEGSEEITKVPRGSIWLEGDNSSLSVDSNTYGPVPLNLLVGFASFVLVPQYYKQWERWISPIKSLDKPERRSSRMEYEKMQRRKEDTDTHIVLISDVLVGDIVE